MSDQINPDCKVRFEPHNIETIVKKGTNLLWAAMKAGVHINVSCGGEGICGLCKVKINDGEVESIRTEKVSDKEYTQGVRLACQSYILSDLTVTVPIESHLLKAIQTPEKPGLPGISAAWRFNPPVIKFYLELSPATMSDNASDLFRLMHGLQKSYNIENLPVDFQVIQKLPGALREKDWKATVTILLDSDKSTDNENNSWKIINVEAGDTRDKLYAAAIDIGTTTICAQLLDLTHGRIVSEKIIFNKQISYGLDVITRIAYSQKPGGLKILQELVVASINEAIDSLLKNSNIERKDISHIMTAGNTTMQHILLGLDTKYIRLSPYTPVANDLPLVKANSLGIQAADHVHVFNFRPISSYVGGDIVSGVTAAGIHQQKKLTFYMDIGTNGEIVIGNSDWMISTSCSAGPAFEGGGIKHGMVAMSGAIQSVSIDPLTLEPTIRTINDSKPRGICGSGLINTIAELLTNKVIEQNGKFHSHLNSKRIREKEDGVEYVLAWAKETQIDKDIVITELDIDNLIRAKAAMYAGCRTLSRNMGINSLDFEQVILSGNFGSSLDIEQAITIGLLPDIPRDRFQFIGNGSLSGARLAAFSSDLLNDSLRISRMMTNVELSDNNDFMNEYVAALFLPHTDEKQFPSVTEKLKNNIARDKK